METIALNLKFFRLVHFFEFFLNSVCELLVNIRKFTKNERMHLLKAVVDKWTFLVEEKLCVHFIQLLLQEVFMNFREVRFMKFNAWNNCLQLFHKLFNAVCFFKSFCKVITVRLEIFGRNLFDISFLRHCLHPLHNSAGEQFSKRRIDDSREETGEVFSSVVFSQFHEKSFLQIKKAGQRSVYKSPYLGLSSQDFTLIGQKNYAKKMFTFNRLKRGINPFVNYGVLRLYHNNRFSMILTYVNEP